jgi:D-alanyl-lipoteichoic acid acyltransferase DltB (MBOAT superfamily)
MSPLSHIVAILVVLPVAHFLPRRARLLLLTIVGAIFMLMLAPAGFWVVLVTVLEAFVLERLLRNLPKKSALRQYLPYVLLLNVFATDFSNEVFARQNLVMAGVAFAVVRVFMTTKQLLGAKSTTFGQRTTSLAAGGWFLPAIVVGPVFSGTSLWDQTEKGGTEPDVGATELVYRKFFAGWLLATLVSEWLVQESGGTDLGRWTAPLVLLALFGHLFAAFWGQSLIAESGAALAGFRIPTNFDRPWLAVDIRDFWNRWHMSMARFVMQYIFLPLNLRGLNARVATAAAFVFMGLWHEVQPGYIVWGVAHGLLMALAPKAANLGSRPARIVSRVATLSSVVVLSYVANYAF